MGALSADKRRRIRATTDIRYFEPAVVTSQVIYHGSLVNYVLSTKRVRVASAATTRKFAGLHMGDTVTGNTAGTVRAKLAYNCEALINSLTALTSAYLGSNAAISTDDDVTTMSGAGTSAVRVRVGQIIEIEDGDVWVWLRNFSESDV